MFLQFKKIIIYYGCKLMHMGHEGRKEVRIFTLRYVYEEHLT